MYDHATWSQRFAEWLKTRYSSADTVRNYRSGLRPFFEFLEEQGVETVTAVGADLLEGYRTWTFYQKLPGTQKSLSVGAQVARLMSVKTFYRFVTQAGFMPFNPAASLELPKVKSPLPSVLSEAEVLRLLEVPDVRTAFGLRDRALLELLYGTALRNSELCGLRLDQVDLPQRQLVIAKGKGLKGRLLPLGDEARAWLEAYLRDARPQLLRSEGISEVFLDRWGHAGLQRSALSAIVRGLAREGKLEKKVTPHTLRHSCATHMLRRGAGLRHLQKLLGHASSATTELYAQVEISDLQRVIARCHPREQ